MESSTTRRSKWPPKRTALMALIVAFGSSFSFGFQLLITNPAQGAFIKFLNASQHSNNPDDNALPHLENEWSFIVALFFLGSTTGAFFIKPVAERFGRKNGVIVSIITQVFSSALTITSYWIVNHYLFMVARVLMGIGITISMGIAAMFVTESSPAYCRGVSSLINGVLLQLSIFIGAIMAMPRILGSEDHWWYLYLFQMIINTAVLCILPMVHESPSYLASQEVKHHHDIFKGQITAAVKFYHEISQEEAEQFADALIDTHQHSRAPETIISVWKTPFNRRGTLLGMMVMFAMAMSGITVINAFAFEILMNVGMKQDTAAIANAAICFFSFAGILVSTKIIDHFGRRPLLISTFGFLTLVNVAIISLMFAYSETQNQIVSYFLIGAICVFNFLFAMGPGPLSMFITGELVPQTCRSASSVWTNAIMAIVRFLTLTFYLPIKNATSEFMAYAIFFIVPMVVAVLVLFFLLPETKGRNVEEIREEYERKALLQKAPETIISVWKTPFNRRGTLLGMMVMFAMAMSGITVINAFAFEILMNVGMKQDTAAIANAAICFFSFAGILVSTKIIDHFGRRPLLISTFGFLTLVNVASISLMFAYSETQNQIVSYFLIGAICVFNFLFAMGPGPLSMFITGELVPQTCRSASSVWTNAIMAIVRFLTLTFYLPIKNATSEFMAYAIFFIVPMVVAVLVLFFLLPETKGRNVEEIREEYERKALLQK
ncbi:unnamed protein product [Caenorhabditis brenneri]